MSTREKVYRHFGPVLIEALCDIIMDEINILREFAGLAPHTKQQLIDVLKAKHDELSPYDWMSE